jgi:hypothetical protein
MRFAKTRGRQSALTALATHLGRNMSEPRRGLMIRPV